MAPRWTVYAALLALALAGGFYLHWDGERVGRLAAEERRLEQQETELLKTRRAALASADSVRRTIDVVDARAKVAEAHRLVAQGKVRVVRPDTLRVTTDSGTVDLPVPTEVTALLVADGAQIQLLRTQVEVRDSLLTRLGAVVSIDTAVFAVKDSITTSVRAQPRSRLKALVIGGIVVGLGTKLVLALLGK